MSSRSRWAIRFAPMPLFLTHSTYVTVPLEETYAAAYRGVPRRMA